MCGCRVRQAMLAFASVALSTTAVHAQRGLLVGDMDGNIALRDVVTDRPLNSVNLNNTAIGRIEVLDLDGDGSMEFVATHGNTNDKPSYAFDLSSFNPIWETSHYTSIAWGYEGLGQRVWSGDFDGDGALELAIPYYAPPTYGATFHIFSAADGTLQSTIPHTTNTGGAVYFDAVDLHWKLAKERSPSGFTHYLRCSDLTDNNELEWETTSVNTWKVGAIGASMIDGEPRIWGGWYGRTLSVVDRMGTTLWQKSFGGSYEAEAFYAGDLRGDGVEVLLVGGTYGWNHVRLDAVALVDGSTLWTFDDSNAHWFLSTLAVEDVNGDGAKEVFVRTAGNSTRPPKYQAIDGANGVRLWEQAYSLASFRINHARVADVNGDGDQEVLLSVDNTIEARDALTGTLVRTYVFDANVTAFEVVGVTEPEDSDGDGVPDEEDVCPESDLAETILIDGCDTEVVNVMLGDDGCWMADWIAGCAEGVTTNGEFVSCVAQLTSDWKKDGLISGRDKGRIQSCAAQGNLWSQCQTDVDCDDGLFCNGVEVCLDRACVVGDPCPGQSCDETTNECVD